MAVPSWAPGLDRVAVYVTSRTVDLAAAPGVDQPAQTFTAGTRPTDVQVMQLVADACDWVVTVTGTIQSTLEGQAGAVAAMRAAAMIEMSYPERNADVDAVANPLVSQARFARDELAAANRAAGSPGPNATGAPLFTFPTPETWRGDDPVRNPRSVGYVW